MESDVEMCSLSSRVSAQSHTSKQQRIQVPELAVVDIHKSACTKHTCNQCPHGIAIDPLAAFGGAARPDTCSHSR